MVTGMDVVGVRETLHCLCTIWSSAEKLMLERTADCRAGSTFPAVIARVIRDRSSLAFLFSGSYCRPVSSSKAFTASHRPCLPIEANTTLSRASGASPSEKRGGSA